jgi:hypothetical protein
MLEENGSPSPSALYLGGERSTRAVIVVPLGCTSEVQWTLAHPRDRTWLARYGVDERGPWAEATWHVLLVRYDVMSAAYDFARPIRGFSFMAQLGFVYQADVEDALTWLSCAGPDCRRGRPRRGVRRVLRVVRNLERASG